MRPHVTFFTVSVMRMSQENNCFRNEHDVRGHLSTLRLVFAACCIVRRKAIIKQCANIIMLATKHLRCTVWSSEHTEAMALLADGLRACFL